VTRQANFEHFLTDVSTRFAGVPCEQVDTEIARTLESLVAVMGTDRATFLELLPESGALALTHSWARPGVRPAASCIPVTGQFPWYHERLRRGDVLRFERLPDELPEDARAERAYAARLPMLSHVAVPLLVDGRWVCALLTATATAFRSWDDADVAKVRIVGQILANAIYRRRLEGELRESLAEVQRLHRRLALENDQLRETLVSGVGREQIAGRSRAVREVLEQAVQVAPTSAAVLLLGETGTGKELLARAIHASSKRSDRPLVIVNCAALPHSLVESELFGHEKGAFTGATSAKPGRFELADGGTLFLDEIGEIPLELQVKLLRVLEGGEFERVGATRSRKVDVRIVAATNRDLARAIAEGRFREDLYYRLSAFPIRLPPLRDRQEDIPLLVWELIHRRQNELGRRIERVPDAAMQALVRYSWPGNVRELANEIERALILSQGPVLRFDAFIASRKTDPSRSERFEDVEREHFMRVLERCQWRITGAGNAAAALGLRPSTLRSRLKKLGVVRPQRIPSAGSHSRHVAAVDDVS
jgi:transcriptional regulator with GAF, ATPase, and Fis domain